MLKTHKALEPQEARKVPLLTLPSLRDDKPVPSEELELSDEALNMVAGGLTRIWDQRGF